MSHDHWSFLLIEIDKLLWSASGVSMVAVRNREDFCKGKAMHENFLQESTGTDTVKIYSWVSCLVATRYTRGCNRDKVNLLFLWAWFLSLGLGPPGLLFFSFQSLSCLRPFPGPFPKWLCSCLPVSITAAVPTTQHFPTNVPADPVAQLHALWSWPACVACIPENKLTKHVEVLRCANS